MASPRGSDRRDKRPRPSHCVLHEFLQQDVLFVVSIHVNHVHAFCRRLDAVLCDKARSQKYSRTHQNRETTLASSKKHTVKPTCKMLTLFSVLRKYASSALLLLPCGRQHTSAQTSSTKVWSSRYFLMTSNCTPEGSASFCLTQRCEMTTYLARTFHLEREHPARTSPPAPTQTSACSTSAVSPWTGTSSQGRSRTSFFLLLPCLVLARSS